MNSITLPSNITNTVNRLDDTQKNRDYAGQCRRKKAGNLPGLFRMVWTPNPSRPVACCRQLLISGTP